MDDITFCISGWKECGVVRCERHPNNITDRTIPHSFAELYQTEYCPLEKPTVKDMVEVVRCKDCRWYKTNYKWDGKAVKICAKEAYEPVRKEDYFCSYGERKDG